MVKSVTVPGKCYAIDGDRQDDLFTATTFKKNESGSDFQRIQIWNDR